MHENKYPVVSNVRDSRFLNLRFLQTPEGRYRSNLYLVEGIRHVARAVDQHAPIESVFVDFSSLSNRFGRKLAERLRKSGVPGIRLAPHLYRELTLASEPQGIGAIVRQKWMPIAELRPHRQSLWLALELIESAGNLGTIFRTAEAAGVSGIFLLDGCSEPYDPAAVRASMGAVFSQKLVRCSVQELASWARKSGVTIVASSPAGLMDYKNLRYRWPVALAVGSEKSGVSEQLVQVSDCSVRIPMKKKCDSLNVAVAAGILLFELASRCPL